MFCYLPVPSSVTKTPNPQHTQRQALFRTRIPPPSPTEIETSSSAACCIIEAFHFQKQLLAPAGITPSFARRAIHHLLPEGQCIVICPKGNESSNRPWIERLGELFFNRSFV
jgi:hypothetical protein